MPFILHDLEQNLKPLLFVQIAGQYKEVQTAAHKEDEKQT